MRTKLHLSLFSFLLQLTSSEAKFWKCLSINYDDWQHLSVMQDLCNKACPDHWALIIEIKDDLHWNCLLFAKRHFLNKRQPKLQARDSGIWWAQNENMKKTKYFDISGGGPWERCSWCCERRQRHFMRWGRCFEITKNIMNKHWHNKRINIQRSYLYYLYHITCLCLEWSVHWGRNAQLQNGSDRERGTSSNVVVMIFIKFTLHNDVWQEYCDLTYHQVRNGCIWMPDNYVKDHVIIYTRILRHLIKTKTKVIANAISRNINLQNLRRASAFIDVMDRKVDRVILVQWWNFPCLLQEAQDFLDHYRDVLAKNKMIQNKGIYKRWRQLTRTIGMYQITNIR